MSESEQGDRPMVEGTFEFDAVVVVGDGGGSASRALHLRRQPVLTDLELEAISDAADAADAYGNCELAATLRGVLERAKDADTREDADE